MLEFLFLGIADTAKITPHAVVAVAGSYTHDVDRLRMSDFQPRDAFAVSVAPAIILIATPAAPSTDATVLQNNPKREHDTNPLITDSQALPISSESKKSGRDSNSVIVF